MPVQSNGLAFAQVALNNVPLRRYRRKHYNETAAILTANFLQQHFARRFGKLPFRPQLIQQQKPSI